MRAPEFWRHGGGLALALSPLGRLWAAATAMRLRMAVPWRAPVPVICIGNLVAGGGGKTPLAIAVATCLAAQGRRPQIVSRGYGGKLHGPVRVDPAQHAAGDVGDEPLLLAAAAPTWVARDRAAGARAAVAAGAETIVLDDGFQNAALTKDLSILAIDGGYGFGNGRTMPAGPLRETLAAGLARADAAVIIGIDRYGVAARLPQRLPTFHARLLPSSDAQHGVAGQTVYAFAGIARPTKFYETLAEMGCRVAGARDFPDHHPFTPDEIMTMIDAAGRLGAVLVTTEKDAVRLPPEARAMIRTVPITLEWSEPGALERLLAPVPSPRIHHG